MWGCDFKLRNRRGISCARPGAWMQQTMHVHSSLPTIVCNLHQFSKNTGSFQMLHRIVSTQLGLKYSFRGQIVDWTMKKLLLVVVCQPLLKPCNFPNNENHCINVQALPGYWIKEFSTASSWLFVNASLKSFIQETKGVVHRMVARRLLYFRRVFMQTSLRGINWLILMLKTGVKYQLLLLCIPTRLINISTHVDSIKPQMLNTLNVAFIQQQVCS